MIHGGTLQHYSSAGVIRASKFGQLTNMEFAAIFRNPKLNYKTNRIPSCCIAMDDKTKQDGRDDSKVDLNDPNEVAYAAKQEGISVSEYKEMAQKAGSSNRAKIAEYIKNNA